MAALPSSSGGTWGWSVVRDTVRWVSHTRKAPLPEAPPPRALWIALRVEVHTQTQPKHLVSLPAGACVSTTPAPDPHGSIPHTITKLHSPQNARRSKINPLPAISHVPTRHLPREWVETTPSSGLPLSRGAILRLRTKNSRNPCFGHHEGVHLHVFYVQPLK